MAKSIYLDYAAATPLDPSVLEIMRPYYTDAFFNPSADYTKAQSVRSALEEARSKIAYWLGARSNEIVFTAGGTEANNLAIHGVMSRYSEANMLYSSVEHESVAQPASKYAHKEIPVGADGRIDPNTCQRLIDDNTVLVSVMYANNEVGTVQPIRQLAQALEVIRKQRRLEGNKLPLILHTDACQASNYLDLHVNRLGVDLMTINGGKMYGPKQSGALFVSRYLELNPQVLGGGQERNLRSGTENVAQDIGLAASLELAQTQRGQEAQRLANLSNLFISLLKSEIPSVEINGSTKYRLPNNVHITIPGTDNESLLIALDSAGIMAAAGSACSASKEEASHVLMAMGKSEADARASLRFSLGRGTTESDIRECVQVLARLITR